LPADAEALVDQLRSQVDLALLRPTSPGKFPVLAESPIVKGGCQLEGSSGRIECYLALPLDADVKLVYQQFASQWIINMDSEVIEFGGCEFNASVLVRGRFYFVNHVPQNGTIVQKRPEFLAWADRIFRAGKKSLRRSKVLDAYVGEEAEKWRQGGGRFAWMVTPARGPIYTDLYG